MRMLALGCCSLLSMGCSFVFVRPPPSQPEPLAYFDCVSSAAAPATDLTNAVVDGLLAASALNARDNEFAAGVGVAGAVYAASAIYGFIMTSRCAGAKERLGARVNELVRERLIQGAELRVERDASQKAPAPPPASEPGGCRRDTDCKGQRICASERCVDPPAAAPVAPPTPGVAPPTPGVAPPAPAPTPAPASPAPTPFPAPVRP